ncbi:MAG: translocation/assembly module TamB domain-containing protein [Gemmatimonadaceae bacterium]
MTRRRRVVLGSTLAILVIGLLAVLAIVAVTQTSFGRLRLRNILISQLAPRVNGKLYLGRISGGLISGVRIDSLAVIENDGTVFIASGPISVTYDVRDLLDRRVLLSHVEVERPYVHVIQREDGSWNFRRLFQSGKPSPARARGRGIGDLIRSDSATIRGGRFLLTLPWHPADSLGGARRDSAIRANLARDDARIRRVPEGFARTWDWTEIDLASSEVRLADPDSSGRKFDIARMSVTEADPPLRFHDMRGEVRVHGDSVWLDLPHFALPGSTGRATGKIVWGSDLPIRYDIRAESDSVALADFAWVHQTLPRTGGGAMRLHIHNDPDDLHVLNYALSDLDVRTTKSRLRGTMTYGVGGPVLRVTDVDVRAQPVDMDLLRVLAGGPFPYDWQGTITGTLRGRGGPLTRFRVDSSALVYRDARVPGAVSRGSGKGVLDILDPALAVFRDFRVVVDALDMRTPRAVNPDFARLSGIVSGRATLDSVWTDLRLRDADMVHRDGAGEPSRFTGGGRVTLEPEFIRYDLTLDARPLSFTTLARSYPSVPLRGPYAGPLTVRGTLDDLTLTADLAGAAGRLGVDGHFDFFGPHYSAVGSASVAELDLATLLNRLDTPPSSLGATARFALDGDSLPTMRGTLSVEVARGLVDSVRIFPSFLNSHFVDGRAVVDTLRLETGAFSLAAAGGLGLVAQQPDSLGFTLTVDSLGGFRRYLASAVAGADPDTLLGSVSVAGVLSGSAEGIGVRGTVRGDGLQLARVTAREMDGAFNLTDVLGTPRGSARLTLDSVVAGGVRMRSATLSGDMLGGGLGELRLAALSATGPTVAAAAMIRRAGDSTRVRLDSATVVVGGDRWSLARPTDILSNRAGVAIDTLLLRNSGGGSITLAGTVPLVDSLRLTFRADSVPLGHLGLLAQSATNLDGRGAVRVDVTGTRADPLIDYRGMFDGARFGDVRLARLSLTGGYERQRLRGALALVQGDSVLLRADGVLPVDLALLPRDRRLLDEAVSGSIRSDRVDLSVLEAFTTAVRDGSGSFQVAIDLAGTRLQPMVSGGLQVTDGAATLPKLGDVRLRGVNADIALLGDSLAIRRLDAASGSRGSSLTLRGGVGFAHYDNPIFDLTLVTRDFHAIARPRVADLEVSTAPFLQLRGPLSGATVTGGVKVERGTVYLPEFSSKEVIDLEDLGDFNVVDTTVFANRTLLPSAPPALVRNLTLRDVGIAMGDDVWLRGPEANINLGGRVSLTTARDVRSPDQASLALEGILTANRGTYRLNLGLVQRTFSIERGSLRFFGEPDLNPTLDIVAVYTVRQFDRQAVRQDVQVRTIIGGTLVNPQLRLTGGFAGGENGVVLSESDAVSYLVTGAPAFAVGAEQSSQLTAARVALASLGSYLGDRAAGGLFDVVQFQTSGLDQGDTRTLRSAGQSILAGTRLGLGKQLSDRVFVSANAGLCQLGNVVGGDRFNALDFAESIGVKVDYRLGGGLALSAGVEPPTSQLYCGRDLTTRGFAPTPRQWALDLFRTWRF